MTIALTGTTGAVGAAVRDVLGGAPVLIGRDASALRRGFPRRKAAYGDRAAMTAALEGVDTLFFVSGRESATRREEHLTVVEAAVEARVDRIVYLSFLGASQASTFTLARDHWVTEQAIRDSGLAFTFLRDSMYQDSIPSMAGDDGIIRGPAGHGRLSAVSRRDVAAAAAIVLASHGAHDGRSYDLTGPEALTLAEFAEQLAKASGRPVAFHDETEEEAYLSRERFHASPFEVEAWVTSYQAIATGEMSSVSADVELITGRAAGSFSEFLAAHPDSYRHLVGGR